MAQASAEKLEHTGPAKIKKWPQCHKESSWQVQKSRICQTEKEQSRQFRVPDHEGGESRGEREPNLGEKEGDQSDSTERKGWNPQRRKADSKEKREGKQEELP